MKSVLRLVKQIVWPPAAPVNDSDGASQRWWAVTCALNIFLLTAVFHDRIFWAHNCMLIPFGPDYTPAVIRKWLMRDPSLPWALIGSFGIYLLGKKYLWVRVVMAPVFISFLPVTLWIWDIPFTNRIICTKLHDARSIALVGIYLRTRHAFAVTLALYLPFMAYFAFHWRKK